MTSSNLPPPSAWVQRWCQQLAAQSTVLDVACGRGRHVRWLSERGHRVTGVDRDADALQGLQDLAEVLQADIEDEPWPLVERQFDVVLVTNYLWRPLFPVLLSSVATGGLLIYETFAQGQETIGRPSRPEFLLQPGELLRWCLRPDWRVLAFEDGFEATGPRFVQRIVAQHQARTATSASPQQHALLDVSSKPTPQEQASALK